MEYVHLPSNSHIPKRMRPPKGLLRERPTTSLALPSEVLAVSTKPVPIVYWPISSNRLVVIPRLRHTREEWLPSRVVVVAALLHCPWTMALPKIRRHWNVPNSWWLTPLRIRVLVDRLLAYTNEWLRVVTSLLWISKIDIWRVQRPFAWRGSPGHRPIRLVYGGHIIPNDRDSIEGWE